MSGKVNISFLIGNGFDIGILKALGYEHSTTYAEFYNYLTYYLTNKENFIYKEIENRKKLNEDKCVDINTWTDYEEILADAVNEKTNSIVDARIYSKVKYDWEEIQYLFADFLNQVVTPETLKQASSLNGKLWLERFLGDLSEDQLHHLNFFHKVAHGTEIVYHLFNFNYTSLLDNYAYWLFDPHPYLNLENNAGFYPNPGDHPRLGPNKDTFWSVKSSVITHHPHGSISIPASILFGTSANDSYTNSAVKKNSSEYYNEELRKKLDKPYWSRFSSEYEPILDETDLFIIFGHSVGKSDETWWKTILKIMNDRIPDCELIIYDYNGSYLKNKILTYASRFQDQISDRIFTVKFDAEHPLRFGFNFNRQVH